MSLAQRIADLGPVGIQHFNLLSTKDKIAVYGQTRGTINDPVYAQKLVYDVGQVATIEEYIELVDKVRVYASELYLCEYKHGGKPKGRPIRNN